MVYEMIVNVRKDELISVLEANKVRHRRVFLAALEGYRVEALRLLRERIADVEGGGVSRLSVVLDRPEDHTRDYEHVIGMLRMHVGDEFRLDQQTYRNYVGDDWSWSRQWGKLSSSYAAAEYSASYEVVDDEW